jgi:hypothetical protein
MPLQRVTSANWAMPCFALMDYSAYPIRNTTLERVLLHEGEVGMFHHPLSEVRIVPLDPDLLPAPAAQR